MEIVFASPKLVYGLWVLAFLEVLGFDFGMGVSILIWKDWSLRCFDKVDFYLISS